ncbi:MAG: tetratricopeptide repeat protein, partial [Bacteroidia bacterium]
MSPRSCIFSVLFLAVFFAGPRLHGTVIKAGTSDLGLLEKKLNALPGDTSKANLLIKLAEKYRETDAGRSERYAYEAISLAKRINYSYALIRAYTINGRIKQFQNKIPAAYELFQKAYKVAVSVKDSLQIAECYHNIGDLYKMLGMQEESIGYLKKAVVIAQFLRDSNAIPAYSNRVGHVFMDWGEATGDKKKFEEAMKWYNYSLFINQKTRNARLLSISYVNLANANLVFFKHGADRSCLHKSIAFSEKGVELAEQSESKSNLALNLLNIGEAYYLLGEHQRAMSFYDRSLALYKELNKKNWIAA